ncbi:MAG: lysine 2,3-aminomutase, partial [Lachnospiraceae bacterium]|nr:lysine 2,3-aminomutase [Lachnospiraceae bacterium]
MINSADELFDRLTGKGVVISDAEKDAIRKSSETYKMSVSDYYFDLIDWSDINCPIRKQCIPSGDEL